jgi:uncharacterized protein (DUF1684 family)
MGCKLLVWRRLQPVWFPFTERLGVFSHLLTIVVLISGVLCAQPAYKAEVEKWRQEREASLRKDDGWLAVAGLVWLKEGENHVGAGAANQIVLPPQSAPERVGTFVLRSGKTAFTAERGVGVTSGGKPVQSLEMRPDTPGPADIIAVGDLSMQVIKRGSRYGIRLRDKNSSFRREFTGLRWFPVDEAWRIQVKFVPYNPPKQIPVLNIIGDTELETCPGYVAFRLAGKEYRLEPIAEGNRLFIIFRDLTSGKETYPSGRFLYAGAPRDGQVILDFNKAYNPPCAFTPYATCPLPPPQNRLAVRIPAGELTYHSAVRGK